MHNAQLSKQKNELKEVDTKVDELHARNTTCITEIKDEINNNSAQIAGHYKEFIQHTKRNEAATSEMKKGLHNNDSHISEYKKQLDQIDKRFYEEITTNTTCIHELQKKLDNQFTHISEHNTRLDAPISPDGFRLR